MLRINFSGDALSPNPGSKQRIQMVLDAIEEERQSLLRQIIAECDAGISQLETIKTQTERAKSRPGSKPMHGGSLGINHVRKIVLSIDIHVCHIHGLVESYDAIQEALQPKAKSKEEESGQQ